MRRSKGPVELVGTVHLKHVGIDTQGPSGGLQRVALRHGARCIPQDGHPCARRRRVLEEFQPLVAEVTGLERQPSDVAARVRQAGDKPVDIGVIHAPHPHGDGAHGGLGSSDAWGASGHNDVHREARELGGQCREALDLPRGPAELKKEVLSFPIAEFVSPLPEVIDEPIRRRVMA